MDLKYQIITAMCLTASCHSVIAELVINKQEGSKKQSPVKAKTDPYSKRSGSFIYKPELSVFTLYDDNVFAQRYTQEDDILLIIQPSVDIRSDWNKHMLKVNLGAEVGRYHEFSTENFEDAWFDIQGRYDISKRSNLFGGLNYSEDHEERGTPAVVGTAPTSFDSSQAHAGFAHTFGKFKIRIGGTYEKLDFEDSGLINNDDRDRVASSFGFRSSYLYKPNHELFLQIIGDRRKYDNNQDDNGFIRHSDGYRYAIGYKGRLTNRLSMEAYLGKLVQDFDDPVFSKILMRL